MMSRKKYSMGFKMKVAEEASQPEYTGLEHIIASKYGLRPNTVLKWRTLYQEQGKAAFTRSKAVKYDYLSEREKQLVKENAALREEVEILKKVAAFLAELRQTKS